MSLINLSAVLVKRDAIIASQCYNYIKMTDARFPQSQKELLKLARGAATQKEFAMRLKVDKSCLSRYESGKLGAPVRVIDECLKIVASELLQSGGPSITAALEHARMTVKCLEQ
jgi:hypothetical protein